MLLDYDKHRSEVLDVNRTYEEHYVAFIDILGFKELLTSNTACEDIYAVFQSLQDNAHTGLSVDGAKVEAFDKVKYYLMSDSIILYIKTDIQDSLAALIGTCLKLQIRLLIRDCPILLRGGIARGDLFVDDHIIFGKGLSEAYQLECKVAVTPRIVFNKELLNSAKKNDGQLANVCWDTMLTKRDVDDLCYAHYLALPYMGRPQNWAAILDKILNLCQTYLDKTNDKSLREKYLWLKDYTLSECRLQRRLLKDFQGGRELIDKWKII